MGKFYHVPDELQGEFKNIFNSGYYEAFAELSGFRESCKSLYII
jgi:hypothetical protein